MIGKDMIVTVEAGAFPNNDHASERARVIKVVGCFAILDMADGEVRGCVVDCLQPVVTAESLAARFTVTPSR
jgi:hypothetical protein